MRGGEKVAAVSWVMFIGRTLKTVRLKRAIETQRDGISGRRRRQRKVNHSSGRFKRVNQGSRRLEGGTRMVKTPASRPARMSANTWSPTIATLLVANPRRLKLWATPR